MDRVTVQEAARRLGVKDDAIRKRIQRGTLKTEKEPKEKGGRVYVYLDATHDGAHDTYKDATQYAAHDAGQEELVEVLRDEVAHLREQLDAERRAHAESRRIAAILAQRVPELEAASEATRPQDGQGDAPEGSNTPEPETAVQRPWWRRIFGV